MSACNYINVSTLTGTILDDSLLHMLPLIYLPHLPLHLQVPPSVLVVEPLSLLAERQNGRRGSARHI